MGKRRHLVLIPSDNSPQKITKPWTKHLTRRQIIQGLGIGGLTLAGFSGLFTSLDKLLYNEWNFVYQGLENTKLNSLAEVYKKAIPIGNCFEVKSHDWMYAHIKEKAKLCLDRMVHDFPYTKGTFKVTLSTQKYVLPTASNLAHSAVMYSKKALEWLYAAVPSVTQIPLEWEIPQHGKTYPTIKRGQVFLCDSYAEIYRIHLKEEQTNWTKTSEMSSWHGGGENTADITNGQIGNFFIFLPANAGLLLSLFSEIIPLTTLIASQNYALQVGPEKAMEADETIAESLSLILSLQCVKALHVPNGEYWVQKTHEHLSKNEIYTHVPSALDFANRVGPTAALQKYLQSPEEYMRAIGSVGSTK